MKIKATSSAPRTAQAADWALSRGIAALTTAEVAQMLAVPLAQVPQRLSAAKRRGEWMTPARGLWVPVPPEFRGWGGSPAAEFIDALMTYLGATYYVGWLAAAALYGAAHHAPQVTHIATSKMIRERQVGRTRLVFHERSRISELPTVSRMARAGAYRISSPEVTAFDVASDLAISGGLDNVVTVLVDLADETGLDDQTLAKLAARYPDAAVRRIGWIVEEFTVHRLDALAAYVSGLSPTSSRLHPSLAFNGDLDARWNIRLNTTVAVE